MVELDLDTRLCDLRLNLRNTWAQSCIQKLYLELNAKDIRFKPHVWISDDWFSPDGVPGFAIPFFLLHPKLIALEKEMVGYAEGASRQWCMKLMRHETGHAIDNAFHLRKNKTRQSLFGLTSVKYPDSYIPNKRSRDYVRHLEDHYAQAHPDEDWAETFATWLTPRSAWRKTYANWGALNKLQLVDEMMENIKGKRPLVTNRSRIEDISTNTMSLKEYYREKRKRLKLNERPLFQRDMKKIFSTNGEVPAWKYLHETTQTIIGQVAKSTDLKHDKIKSMLAVLKKTCRQEGLKVPQSQGNDLGVSPELLASFISKNSHRLAKDRTPRIMM
ncbi:MAG: putative zinc-binding metallopeptidase [Halobacteriovoraceae bacterium]|nr:putative zinc-binding metallopeptidase [Halobacteriovoraceae bacterium]